MEAPASLQYSIYFINLLPDCFPRLHKRLYKAAGGELFGEFLVSPGDMKGLLGAGHADVEKTPILLLFSAITLPAARTICGAQR